MTQDRRRALSTASTPGAAGSPRRARTALRRAASTRAERRWLAAKRLALGREPLRIGLELRSLSRQLRPLGAKRGRLRGERRQLGGDREGLRTERQPLGAERRKVRLEPRLLASERWQRRRIDEGLPAPRARYPRIAPTSTWRSGKERLAIVWPGFRVDISSYPPGPGRRYASIAPSRSRTSQVSGIPALA
jgi:hypothetical protein